MLCNIAFSKAHLNRQFCIQKFVRLKSYYAILGVPQKATQKEIRDAYIKLSKEMHPDLKHGAKTHDKFVQINEAYEVLGKDSSRRDYDDKLRFEYPKPTSNPYQQRSPPSNYYSSGQFYEDSPFKSGFDPSNPYARRAGHNYQNDPFSDLNYDHDFYRKRREQQSGVSVEPEEEEVHDDDRVVNLFGKVLWGLVFVMACYLLKEIVYNIYIDKSLSRLKEELERKKKMKENREVERIVRSMRGPS